MVKIDYVRFRHLHVSARCPKCGTESRHDKGHCSPKELKSTQVFWCENHGCFSMDIDWGQEINKLISSCSD